MMEEGKKINFYRLGLENGRRYRMELTDEYRLTRTDPVNCPLPMLFLSALSDSHWSP